MKPVTDWQMRLFLDELLGAALLDGLIDQAFMDLFRTDFLSLDLEGQRIRFTTPDHHQIAFWQIENGARCAFRAETRSGVETKGDFYGRHFPGMSHGDIFARILD